MKNFIFILSMVATLMGGSFLGKMDLSAKEKAKRIHLKDLTKALALKEKISQKEAKKIIQGIFQKMGVSLKNGKKIQLTGFGSFYLKKQKARTWKNPKTKKIYDISSRFAIRFRPSGKLKIFVNPSALSKTDGTLNIKLKENKLKILFLEISKELKNGKDVSIRGFGTFYISKQKARLWKHPKTKKEIQLPPRNSVRFRSSSKLKKLVNEK